MKRLTPSELQILKKLAQGYSAKQIANILKRKGNTIYVQLYKIRQKIFGNKPIENISLVLWYLEQIGLLDEHHYYIGKNEEIQNGKTASKIQNLQF